MESLSRAQARRIALAAQGFHASWDKPHATVTMRTLQRTIQRTGVLQVDSVNVLQRAHFMPLYSRMGPYDVDLLRRASTGRERRLVEYWAHVQALMPVELWPVMEFRREHYRRREAKWWQHVSAELRETVLKEVTRRGGVTARHLDDGKPRPKLDWGWNWSDARKALDLLYMTGDLAIAGRNGQFEVIYDLPERVLPREILELPPLPAAEAHVELVRRAVRSHGVGTARDLADYYRMSVADTTRALEVLTDTGEVTAVQVEGIRRPAYLHTAARLPRRVHARALLSPFDPLVWERERTEALFDFYYRIEIYTPAHKRVHGYYVLPFLLGERIVARVDLKGDRLAGVLLVKGAYAEQQAPPETAAELAAELVRLAGWLGLGDVAVEPRGDLAPGLAASLAAQLGTTAPVREPSAG